MKSSLLSLFVLVAVSRAAFADAPVEITTPELRGAVQPQVAVAPSGRIHVVFGKDNAVYYTASDDGRAFSKPTRVGELDKLALKMRRGPRVTATDSLVLVTAISHTEGNLYAWTSSDGGKTFRKSATVNSAPRSAQEGLQALGGDGKGNVAVAWMDNRSGKMEVWARFSKDGGATWEDDRVVYSAPNGPVCPCCHPSVAFAPTGEIAIMWRNALNGSRDMHVSITRDGGKSFSTAQKLGDGTWKLEGCPMDGGSVAMGPDGKWVTAWRRESKLFVNGIGEPERQFAEGKQPVVAHAGKDRLILWEQNGALKLQDASGKTTTLASAGSGPSAVSGAKFAIIAWEAGHGGSAGLFVQRLPGL